MSLNGANVRICFYPLQNVLEGYNGTVFAYGQTGSGKSFSMQGPDNIPIQKGVIPRTFEHIFEATATTENVKFLVCASYLEVTIRKEPNCTFVTNCLPAQALDAIIYINLPPLR